MTARDVNRIVTPDTDPERFTAEEAALFRAGKCGEVTESGNGHGVVHCGRPSKRGASFGQCDEHNAGMLVDHYPDGSKRANVDPQYMKRADYQERVNEMVRAHQRSCTDRECECRT